MTTPRALVLLALAAAAAPAALDGPGGPEGPEGPFRLQILHFSDVDGDGREALGNVGPFSALVAHFRARMPGRTLLLSAGDNMIPSLRHRAAGRASMAGVLGVPAPGRGDVALLNALGVDASALGNHELDLGAGAFLRAVAPEGGGGTGPGWPGASFPYLASNADVPAVAASAVLPVGGGRVAVVGAVTPDLPRITGATDVAARPAGFDPRSGESLDALAELLQREVDAHTGRGIDKVVLLSHMQDLALERALARRLVDVDVVVAGGSGSLLADADDRVGPGGGAAGPYPVVERAPDGRPVLVVSTDGDYRHLGRLALSFDGEGRVLMGSLDPSENGVASSDPGSLPPGARPIPGVLAVAAALGGAVRDAASQEGGRVLARTPVPLEGARGRVRTGETNLGSLVADSMLGAARARDGSARAALMNGGGLRASVAPGPVSVADVRAVLPFDGGLVLVRATAAELATVLEHALGGTAPGEEPSGRFPQVAGLRLSFDPAAPAVDWRDADDCADPGNPAFGTVSRLRGLEVAPVRAGGAWDRVVEDGALVGDPGRGFLLATVDFLAAGGDSFPWPCVRARAGRRPPPGPFEDQRGALERHLARRGVAPAGDGRRIRSLPAGR